MGNKDNEKENSTQARSGSERLNAEIDLLKSGVADDLVMIREGKEGDLGENLKYISFDKDHKNFNRLKVLVSAIRLLEDKPERSVKGKDDAEIPPTQEETTTTVVKKRFNIQDFAIDK